jgi:hypothetical protein
VSRRGRAERRADEDAEPAELAVITSDVTPTTGPPQRLRRSGTDTPRRWQVASLATAVTSLGIGGLLLGRPSDPLQPIVFDVRADAGVSDLPPPLDPIELEEDGRWGRRDRGRPPGSTLRACAPG